MRIMRLTIAILACLVAGAYAGMIDYPDNDRFQIIKLDCAGFDSLTVGWSLNDDSIYSEKIYQVGDSIVPYKVWQFIPPDRDNRNRVIPGHYAGVYRYYVDSWLVGDRIAGADTIRVIVDYTVPGGCSATHITDPH